MEKYHHAPVQDFAAISAYAGQKDFQTAQPEPEAMRKDMPVIPRHKDLPSEEEIAEALHSMGKFTREDELNCGTCGYNTCRDKAIAICQGKAEITMCLPYLMARSQGFADIVTRNIPSGLIVVNDKLEIQQMNPMALQMLRQKDPAALMGEQVGNYIDTSVLIQVLTTGRTLRDQPVHMPQYDLYVMETVVYDREFHLSIIILRDVTASAKEKIKKDQLNQQTIETADRVIDHQMRIVQEIASLLGETAAETKIALTRLKESMDHE